MKQLPPSVLPLALGFILLYIFCSLVFKDPPLFVAGLALLGTILWLGSRSKSQP